MRKLFIKRLSITIGILITLGLNVFATNPNFSIIPGSGSNLKLYCRYNFNIIVNSSGLSYNAFDSSIRFNSGEVNIQHSSIDSFFSQGAQGLIKSGFIYRAQGAASPGTSSTITKTGANFVFYSIGYIGSTVLSFTNNNGSTISFGPLTTDDGSSIASSTNSKDILESINNASYNFLALPCIIDNDNPTISNINISNGATQIPSNQIISMFINDRVGIGSETGPSPLETNNKSHYRYSGLSINPGNYVSAPSNVDNQEGVNSSSIRITLSGSGYGPYVLSGTSLILSNFTGNGTINQYTRDSEIRGYNVSFNPPSPYPIEKQITINISANDRANEIGQIHTGNASFSFNSPILPSAIMLSPSPTTFVNPSLNEISFYLTDDWAGIDTGSVVFTIGGYTYSGNDLTFSLPGGATGIGNGGDYIVSINPVSIFPANTVITITGTFSDLAGSIGTANFSFTTRPDCNYFGCSTFLGIDINGVISAFSGDFLIITGTNPYGPYPYLTGANNDIMMCGPNYTGTIINGNIQLQNTNNQSAIGTFYSGKKLYITGLDLILSGNIIFIQ